MRRRNMYYATGLPGWMRFGYSPGRGGLAPCAQFLMTGQWPTPQMAAAWQAMQGGGGPGMGSAPFGAQPSREQQLDLLRQQATMLEQHLEAIRQQMADLEQASE